MRRAKWYLALPMAALGGYFLDAATPQPAFWPLAFAGAILIFASFWQQRLWLGLFAGAIAGAFFWLPQLSWLTLYLGPIPWLALSTLMFAWFALAGVAIAATTRGLAQLVSNSARLLVFQAFAATGIWVLREQIQGLWPYGGFAWGRLAHTQAEGPLVALSSWWGLTGLSALITFACAIIVASIMTTPKLNLRLSTYVTGTVVLTLGIMSVVPPAPLEQIGALRVAAVQGNSKSGIFDDRENGDVFRSHLLETQALLDELEQSGTAVDVIVWPENSAEFNLPQNATRMLALQKIADRADAPVVVGTILKDADGRYTNSTIVIDRDGDTGVRYDKRRPVPFAEYMPNREFFHALVPDLVDLVQLEYTPGTRSSVIDIEAGSRTLAAGIAICFDIIFDDHAVAMSAAQSEIIFAQTNNADFGRTDESAQQLAIARIRAVETGRTLVNISTVGTSAIVAPDGSDLARLPTHVAGYMVAEVPLVTGKTPALQFGAWIAGAWMGIGVTGFLAGLIGLTTRRKQR